MDGTAHTTVAVRSCGEEGDRCTACCFTHAVDAQGDFKTKYNFNTCTHCVQGHGCSIYTEGRPDECEEFQCYWKETGIGERPDLFGIVCSWGVMKWTSADPPRLIVYESRIGALEEPPVLAFIEARLAEGVVVEAIHQDVIHRYQYHCNRTREHELFGIMISNRGRKVVWHELV